MEENCLTVGDLKWHLKVFRDDDRLLFQGGLTFHRLKQRGPDLVMLEFNEAQADLTAAFRRRNPRVKVAFIDTSGVLQPGQIVGDPIDITVD